MGLFSFFRKNKQESPSGDSEFYSRAEEESAAIRGKRKSRKPTASSAVQVLPEKKRARRRLVGSAALVLAAVIGLPMVLDSKPKPLADDITIQIPSKDLPLASATHTATANPSKVAAAETLGQKEEVVDVPAATAKPSVDSKASDTVGTVPSDKPAPGVPPQAKAETTHKADQKPTATPSDKIDDAARAAAILEGKAAPAKPAVDGKPEKIVLQVAALASKEKIDELQGKLKKAGIASYTQKVATESGDRTRIRVGPFANKEEADKMRAKLAKLGLNGTVVPSGH